MQYTNSLEGYCANPLTKEDIAQIHDTIQSRKDKQKLVRVRYRAAVGLVVVAYSTFVICLQPGFYVIPCGILLALWLLIAAMFAEFMSSPDGSFCIRIHGQNLAWESGCINEVAFPAEGVVSSPLGRDLIKNVRAQERKLLSFEKKLVQDLCSF